MQPKIPTLKVLFVLILCPFFIWALQEDNKILIDLEKAKENYLLEVESVRNIFFKKMEDQIKITAQTGNLEVVQRLLAEKKEFELNNSKVPMAKEIKTIVVVFQKENKKKRDALIYHYDLAIKELTKKLDLDLAVQIKNEMTEFQNAGNESIRVADNSKKISNPKKGESITKSNIGKNQNDTSKAIELIKEKYFVNSIDMKFVRVPPGKFLMGSPADEPDRNSDETLHEIHIKKGFYIGVYEVTQTEWLKLMPDNPSRFKGENFPITEMRGHRIDEFIKKLIDKEKIKYSLPTEEQWEYACRAGTNTPFYFGKIASDQLAHIDFVRKSNSGISGKYFPALKPVGSFSPNLWGIYDMHGSVFEICKDLYKPYIQGEDFSKEYYQRIPEDVRYRTRVYRGGSAVQPAHFARSAARFYGDYTGAHPHGGIRLVLNDD